MEEKSEAKEKVTFSVKEKASIETLPAEKRSKERANTVRELAKVLCDQLTSVNIIVNPKEPKFPYVEIGDTFGECGLSFDDIANTEIKIHCFVEKGYGSLGRARGFSQRVLGVINGEHNVGSKRVKITFSRHTEHSEGGSRYVTLCLTVTRAVKK
jgi:hypothetical protein